MLHRYLERDHEQLAELCLQRDQLEQKLSFEQGGTDNSEQALAAEKADEKAALPEEEEADLSQGQRFLNNSKPRSQSVITWRRNATTTNSTITKTKVQDPNPNSRGILLCKKKSVILMKLIIEKRKSIGSV